MKQLTDEDAVLVELYDNPLTPRTDDRYGRVVNVASVGVDKLIERAVAHGAGFSSTVAHAVVTALDQEAVDALAGNETVTYGLAHHSIHVEGIFIGDNAEWNPEVNKLVVKSSVVSKVRQTISKRIVKVLGKATNKFGINKVVDQKSDKENSTITPGGIGIILGQRIQVVGTDPTVGVFLTVKGTTNAVKIDPKDFSANQPSKISLIWPATLQPDDYTLSITTQYSAGGTPREKPQTTTFEQTLTVG
jgi:hypothetical protein